jgi:hypothetical protein
MTVADKRDPNLRRLNRWTVLNQNQEDEISRPESATLSYAVKAQAPDGKITWARRSKRLAPYGDDICEGLDVDLAFPESAAEGELAAATV